MILTRRLKDKIQSLKFLAVRKYHYLVRLESWSFLNNTLRPRFGVTIVTFVFLYHYECFLGSSIPASKKTKSWNESLDLKVLHYKVMGLDKDLISYSSRV